MANRFVPVLCLLITCLLGCSGPKATKISEPISDILALPKSGIVFEYNSSARATTVIAPPRPLALRWTPGAPNVITEVWSKTNLTNPNWDMFTETWGNSIEFYPTNETRFFIIRHRDSSGQHSEWNK